MGRKRQATPWSPSEVCHRGLLLLLTAVDGTVGFVVGVVVAAAVVVEAKD